MQEPRHLARRRSAPARPVGRRVSASCRCPPHCLRWVAREQFLGRITPSRRIRRSRGRLQSAARGSSRPLRVRRSRCCRQRSVHRAPTGHWLSRGHARHAEECWCGRGTSDVRDGIEGSLAPERSHWTPRVEDEEAATGAATAFGCSPPRNSAKMPQSYHWRWAVATFLSNLFHGLRWRGRWKLA